MKTVTAFEASDGKLFATGNDAQEYEFSLMWRDRIGEFGRSDFCPYPNGAQNSMMVKIVIAWERFKTEKVLP